MSPSHQDPRVDSAIARSEDRRLQTMRRHKERFERSAATSGSLVIGRDASLAQVRTLPPKKLGMQVRGWRVQLSFKREDRGLLREMSWRDAEATIQKGGAPIKLVLTENHIITAVRELAHIEETYAREARERIDAQFSPLIRVLELNFGIHSKGAQATDDDIRALIAELRELKAGLSKKLSAVKSMISVGRMDFAISKFEAALEPGANNRAFRIGSACPVLLSVSERLSKWRDRQVAAAVSKTQARLASLRPERDRWLFAQFSRFSSSTPRIADFVALDSRKKEVLCRVGGMLGELKAQQQNIRRLERRRAWSAEDEAALVGARAEIQTMKEEASRCRWLDANHRKAIQQPIRSLEKRKKRTDEQEAQLAELRRIADSLKAEASQCRWTDSAARGALRKRIRALKKAKERAGITAPELAEARAAFADKTLEARRCIWANAALLLEIKNGEKPKALTGDYGWLHRHIKEGRLDAASDKLAYLMLFLDSNKPGFILEELSKMPEPYMVHVLGDLKLAVEALECKDLKKAQGHFTQAAQRMREIAYPAAM